MAATSKNGAAARTKSVGTKLTEEKFARLESLAAAAGQSVSEWARSALLAATTPTPVHSSTNPNPNSSNDAVLGEVRALRAIVLNLFFDLAKGEEITVESVKEIIAKADAQWPSSDSTTLGIGIQYVFKTPFKGTRYVFMMGNRNTGDWTGWQYRGVLNL
ncbi:MAG: hypothetical protein ACK5YZ_02140, partial [bacterium]